jgi:hypothetical protein
VNRFPAPAGRAVRLRTVVAGLAGVAVVAGVLAPGAVGAAEPTPSASPGASASPSATPTPAASPSVSARPVVTRLPAPRVLGPVEGVVLKTVVLDWTAVAGAEGYKVEVGTDEDWSDGAVYGTEVTSGATAFTLPVAVPHASYVWRVAATTKTGQGRWSSNGSFVRAWTARPTPLTPTPDRDAPDGWTFAWTPVAGASEYQLQVSTVPTFDDGSLVDRAPTQTQNEPLTESCFTTRTEVTPHVHHGNPVISAPGDCSLTLVRSDPTQRRYWRVRALDHYVSGKVTLPTAPVTDEGISHLPPNFKGNDLDLTACPKLVADEPLGAVFPSPSPSATGTASASPSPSSTGGVKPPVLSCTPANPVEKGAWSETTRFSMSWPSTMTDHTTFPLVETHELPETTCTAALVCRDIPMLSWDEVPGAMAYRVYLALDPSYSNIVYVGDVLGTEWVPLYSLRDNTAGQAYYYAVQACSAIGCGDVPAEPLSFRKRSPAVVPTGPAEGAQIAANVGQVTFTWKDWSETLADVTGAPATSGPTSYRVQVTTEDDPDFTDTLLDAEVDETAFVPPTVRFPDGRLLWRVQAIDASGNRQPFSPVHSFVRDVTAPAATVLDTARLAVDGTVALTFSEPVTGVDATSVKVNPAANVTVRLAADRLSAVISPATRWLLGAKHTVELAPTIKDLVGNAVQPAAGDLEVVSRADDGSPALGYAGRWNKRAATNALGGGFHASTPTMRAQTAVTVSLYGKGVRVTGCQGPTGGLADVWVDGVKRARVDTYRRWSGCGVTLAEYALPSGRHQVQLRGVGLKRPASKGTALMVDAVDALQ